MISVLGINHNTAALTIREQFSISSNDISDFAAFIQHHSPIKELIVLSTCNRSEIYFYQTDLSQEESVRALTEVWHQFKLIQQDYSRYFYSHHNREAIKHLFSVTSGLDSMIFGEYQIVNQVKEAYLTCTELALTEAVLMRLFQKSFETGKKVRSSTDIQLGATSVSYAAVDKCQKILGQITEKQVLFVGAGETGKLVLQKMKKLGMSRFDFTNRTIEKARELAELNKGEVLSFDSFTEHLSRYDIVVTATDAGKVLITPDHVKAAGSLRNGNTQVYIDLSVPRNIHHGVKAVQHVHLMTIDDLTDIINTTAEQRLNSKQEALVIIDKMVDEYIVWYQNRSLRPVIQAITENIQKLHEKELSAYISSHNSETLQAVDQYATRLTQKYIRTLIKNLKDLNSKGDTIDSLDTIKELFIFDNTLK